MSSIGGRIHVLLSGWYHATKFAVEGFSDALRVEVAPFGIQVVVIEPGAINTEWHGVAADNLLATSGVGAYADQAAAVAKILAAGRTRLVTGGDRQRCRSCSPCAASAEPLRRRPRRQAGPAGPSSVAGQGVRPHRAARPSGSAAASSGRPLFARSRRAGHHDRANGCTSSRTPAGPRPSIYPSPRPFRAT